MGEARRMNGERCIGVLVGKHEERRPLGRLKRKWADKKKWIFRKRDGGRDWINLAQNRDGWRALLNAVIKLGAP
jgi:hypothetical protein